MDSFFPLFTSFY